MTLLPRRAVLVAICLVPACRPQPPSNGGAAASVGSPIVAAPDLNARALADTATEDAPNAERYSLDLDGDGQVDELTFYYTPHQQDPGAYDRLDLKLSSSGLHSVTGLWDSPRSTERIAYPNMVASPGAFVGRFQRAGVLIFLRGPDVGCCLQSLQIFQVTHAGPVPYFESEEWGYRYPLAVQPNDVTVMVGYRGMSEGAGTSAPDHSLGWTYNPLNVIRFEERAHVDTAASADSTRKYSGGFAGVVPTQDIFSIARPDSSRYLWDEVHKRVIP